MSQSLLTLIEQVERQRDQTLLALQQAQAQCQRAQQQAEQLRGYRDETHQRGPTAAGRSAGAEMLHCHQNFMQRLAQAMDQQQGQVQTLAQRRDHLQQALLAQELRLASVRKLIGRRAQSLQAGEDRREQRRCDESTQQAQWRAAQGRGHSGASLDRSSD